MIKKGLYYLRREGVFKTLMLTFSYLFGELRTLFYKLMSILLYGFRKRNLHEQIAGKHLIVFTPTVEWNYLFQRAQHMAQCFGERDNCTVLYLSTQRQCDSFLCVRQVSSGVFAANEWLAGRIDSLAADATDVVSCVYNITSMDALERYHSDKYIYEYVDDLRFIVSDAEDVAPYEKRHMELLQRADLSVATATKLYEEIAPIAKNACLLPNAVDYDFFCKPAEPKPEISRLCKGYSCVLEYYGAIASWFDYETVRQSALAHPDWLWLLIGKCVGSDMEKSGIQSIPNVRWIPPVSYQELPSYIASADILTIPFVINETTLATSPVKLFEYMATQKPIITSDMPECRKYGSVLIYHDPEEMMQLQKTAMALRQDPEYLQTERKEALENTWQARCSAELAAIGLEE